MKNNLLDLNNHLFAQIERLNVESLSDDDLKKEIDRSKALSGLASQVVSNAKLALEARQFNAEYGRTQELPSMLESKTLPPLQVKKDA